MVGTRRNLLLASIAITSLLTIGAGNIAAAQDATPAPGSAAQVEVTGIGEAEAEASGAIVQLILRRPYELSEDPMSESKFGPTGQPEVTAEQVATVVSALTEAGVAESRIGSAVSAYPFPGMFGFGTAVVAFEIDRAGFPDLLTIVDASVAAGEGAGVQFDPIAIAYMIDDCVAAEREALAVAVADAQAQAESLAQVLGVRLGSLQKASTQSAVGGYYGGGGPIPGTCDEQPTLETGLTTYLMAVDPARIGSVELYAQVVLTYAIA